MPKMTAKPTDTKVKYPKIVVAQRWLGAEGPITYDEMAKWLGYESEQAYRDRTGYKGELSDAAMKGQVSIIKDREGSRFILHHNYGNRDFDLDYTCRYEQEILQRKWAGPTCMPGETVNGETIIFSRVGRCQSGQKRGVALIWAVEKWRKNPEAYPQWKTEPVLESLIVFGVSDNPLVVQTLDNTQPRTTSDMLYTTGVFDDKRLTTAERKELNRKLAAAIGLVWKRTRADVEGSEYMTHSATSDFLKRHKRLLDCVKHVFEVDSGENGRPISSQRLNSGETAGLMYLFATSASDLDKYLGDNRSEKRIDFSLWDKAEKFVSALAKDDKLEPVREALAALIDVTPEEGLGGRQTEKHAILVKAWNLFKAGKYPALDDLTLEYGKNPNTGQTVLVDWPRCGGIDQGDHRGDKDRPPTREEIEEQKRRIIEKKPAKVAAPKVEKKADMGAVLADLKEKHPGRLFLFLNPNGDWNAWGEDAKAVHIDLDLKAFQDKENGWLLRCVIPNDEFDSYVHQLAVKNKVALVKKDEKTGQLIVSYWSKK